MEQTTRIALNEIPFEKLEKAGIKKDFVDRMENQERVDFLNGYRSAKLYTVNAKINGEDFRIPAKIRLQKAEDGAVNVKVHPIQRLNIPDEYMGHAFTKDEKMALLDHRNLGKTLELTGRNGKTDSYYLAIDQKTNELIPLRTKAIKIPDSIKGATLSDKQKKDLAVGKKVAVEGMKGKNGKAFSASLQINAANRNIAFSDFKQDLKEDQKNDKTKAVKPKKN